jgi:hypothetical protein
MRVLRRMQKNLQYGKITKDGILTEANEANEGLSIPRQTEAQIPFVTFVAFCRESSVFVAFPYCDVLKVDRR